MWVAKITSIVDNDTKTSKTVTFDFVNEETGAVIGGIEASGFIADEDIKRYAYKQLQSIIKKTSVTSKAGDLDLSDAEPSVTPQVEAENAFSEKVQKLQGYQYAITLGLVHETDQGYLDFQKQVKGDFSTDYLPLLGGMHP